MGDKYRYSTGQFFDFAKGSYFERTSRPIYAVVFLLPFIVFYELGTIFINTDVLNQTQVRVVAFVWMQNFLEYLGFGVRFAWAAPALAVVVILLALQIVSQKKWQWNLGDIGPMAVECILLAIPLIVLSLAVNSSLAQRANAWLDNGPADFAAGLVRCAAAQGGIAPPRQNLLANIVTGIGAGIYEELVFRLILICVLMIVFQDFLGLSRNHSMIAAVLISAALFSAHHHFIFFSGRLGQSYPFNWTEFIFRTIAGVYFAVLFAVRGFGITAGTHAFYDIIATVINAVFFQQ